MQKWRGALITRTWSVLQTRAAAGSLKGWHRCTQAVGDINIFVCRLKQLQILRYVSAGWGCHLHSGLELKATNPHWVVIWKSSNQTCNLTLLGRFRRKHRCTNLASCLGKILQNWLPLIDLSKEWKSLRSLFFSRQHLATIVISMKIMEILCQMVFLLRI